MYYNMGQIILDNSVVTLVRNEDGSVTAIRK